MGPANSDPEPTLRGHSRGQRVFDRYTLKRLVGRGGMGVVWCARDEVLGEDVALKFLADSVRWDPCAMEDLKAETRRARQLTHPNIIRTHDFVEDASGAAISMEFVDGPTLAQVRMQMPHRVLDPVHILGWLPQLCAALDYAHIQGRVAHRDLKPSNILLSADGVVKVGDFGIARGLADSITRVSMMSAGTLVYMSPQQAMGDEPTAADDIYALGSTLYELLTGKPPFHTGDVRVQLFHRKPDSISARRQALLGPGSAGVPARIPLAWEKTIAACLEKDASDRPASVGEIVTRLSGLSECSREGQRVDRARRRRLHSLALAAALLVPGALAAWRFWPRPAATPTWASDATRAVGAWNFDADGTDGSGHGLDATGVHSAVPAMDRHGRVDRALHFNGSSALIIPDSPLLRWAGDEPFTVAIWVRPDAIRAEGNLIITSSPANVGDNQWHLGIDEAAAVRFSVSRMQEEGSVYAKPGGAVRAGEWTHLAGVSDGRRLHLFIDGKLTGEMGLTRAAIGRRPKSSPLRLGMADLYARSAYSGDLDELRVWRRALAPAEVAAVATSEPRPRFAISGGIFSELDDLPAAIAGNRGRGATLADWEDLRRWHADDTRAWCEDVGLLAAYGGFMVQRAGERIWKAPRHYSIIRVDGTKPAYYLAHDELGGMTLALGSWHTLSQPVLMRLPPAAPRVEKLEAVTNGMLARRFAETERAFAIMASWRGGASRDSRAVRCELRLRDGRLLAAGCTPEGGRLALVVGDGRQPEVARQIAAGWGEFQFTVVARDGWLRFRAISPLGGRPLFQEQLRLPAFRASEVVELMLAGVDAAQLIVE